MRDTATSEESLRRLVLEVAQATAEYIADQDYESPADIWAERKQLAEEVTRAVFASAEEDPGAPLAAIRRAMR